MIVLDLADKRPLYEQIVERFKELIAKGILQADEQMPSVRSLAVELSINPNTIQKAYMELERAGFIYPVKGRGNFVSDISGLLKDRQQQYFGELDALLKRSENYSLDKEDIIAHIEEFYGE